MSKYQEIFGTFFIPIHLFLRQYKLAATPGTPELVYPAWVLMALFLFFLLFLHLHLYLYLGRGVGVCVCVWVIGRAMVGGFTSRRVFALYIIFMLVYVYIFFIFD